MRLEPDHPTLSGRVSLRGDTILTFAFSQGGFGREIPSRCWTRRSGGDSFPAGTAADAGGRGASQSRAEAARKTVSPDTAAGRWHPESGTDRTEQRELESPAISGLREGASASQGDPLPAVGEEDGARSQEGPVVLGSSGLLHAAFRTAADDDAVPHGDPSASPTETHRDDLRGGHPHLAHYLYGRPAASRRRPAESLVARPLGWPLGGR